MRRLRMLIAGGSALLLAPAAGAQMEIPSSDDVMVAIGHLGAVPIPEDNPLTQVKVELGQRLFEDPELSGDGSTSCLTCHLPEHGFAAPERLGPAYPSQTERRNSPTLINVAYNLPLIWDGRAGSLDKQALGPLRNIFAHEQQPRPPGAATRGRPFVHSGFQRGVRRRTDHAGARRQRDQLIRAHRHLRRCADRPLHGRQRGRPHRYAETWPRAVHGQGELLRLPQRSEPHRQPFPQSWRPGRSRRGRSAGRGVHPVRRQAH